MSVAYQMPITLDQAKKVARRRWRKPILRAGRISKNGVELDVTSDVMDAYVTSFVAGAKDQVQFLAGHHEDDLDAFRGDLVGLERVGDVLYGDFDVTDRADRLLEENPRLGASVSVVDRFQRADGRDFGPTLLHVAATFDPEVSRLGDWVRSELSADPIQVIDLSGPDKGPPHVAPRSGRHDTSTQEGDRPVATPVDLTEEELAAVRAVLPILPKLVATDDPKDDNPGQVDGTGNEDDLDASDEPTDAELTAMDLPAKPKKVDPKPTAKPEPPKVDAEDREPELVAAGHERDEALNLANARIDAQQVELARMRRERDDERFKAEKKELTATFGIPGDVVELARPLLHGTGHTLRLSAGKDVDTGQVMRKVLHELGRRYAKALDLGAEYGTADAEDDKTARKRDLDDFVALVNNTERR